MQSAKRALVLGGKTGLLGQALSKILRQEGWEVFAPLRGEIDIFSEKELSSFLQTNNISYIFNTIAYTQVDQAEEEQEQAFLLNRNLPRLLTNIAKKQNLYLIHYSTDYVFDGKKQLAYLPEDNPRPLNVYGQSKYAGEKSILENKDFNFLLIRTAWLFGEGKENFVSKILKLAQEKESLKIVHDQVGSPTYTKDLASYTLKLLDKKVTGIFHIVNSGQASWCELAQEAINCAGLHCKIIPITSKEYPQKALRPSFSVLDTQKFTEVTEITPRPWIQALREYLFSLLSEK